MELESQRSDPSSMESAQDLVRKFRPLLELMAARSGDHELLGELEHVAENTVVMHGWPRDVVIDLAAASEGDTKLHRAAAGGDSECYRRCVDLASDGDSSRLLTQNGDGDTPLHCTARAGHTRMVKHLIDIAKRYGHEMAVTMRNNRGETALHEAIRSGCEKTWSLQRIIRSTGSSMVGFGAKMKKNLVQDPYNKLTVIESCHERCW